MVMSSDTSEKSGKQKANTVIFEIGGAKSDDIDDLRRGEGKVFKKIGQTIEQLKESGEVSDNIQPIIVILKKKKSKKGLLD
ncbi:MAG: hypothetical protein F6K48_09375 [Okeania sp. SIO3H1]|uniref:DUF6200 domain-containing protein n=1 Tax=Okeania sp. SIO1I7 TaxID=2607772 RepID=UPI0013C7543A|nr:hypothetical protein [Okeania sp. SIO1I7]NEN89101.1 hypothetical protein [Okeania sp. SIO3H1]NET25419.1 hypothetical protein [Okeania sp. SIO1I7]